MAVYIFTDFVYSFPWEFIQHLHDTGGQSITNFPLILLDTLYMNGYSQNGLAILYEKMYMLKLFNDCCVEET